MSFLKQTGLVAAGVGGGQLIVLLGTPYLARIYTPAEFGQYAVFVAGAMVLLTLACLRYEVAVPVVKDNDVDSVSFVALVSALLTGVFVFLILFSGSIGSLFPRLIHLHTHAFWLALATIFSGWMQVAVYRSIRSAKFGLNFTLRIVQPMTFLVIAILFQSTGLIPAHVIGLGAAALVGLVGSKCTGLLFPIDSRKALSVAKANRDYPLFSLPTAVLDSAAVAFPIMIISASYGDAAAGNFSQAQRLIAAPLLLVGIAVGQVFFKHSGENFRTGNSLKPLMWKTVIMLGGGGGLLLVAAWAFGHSALLLLLGEGWRTDTAFILLVLLPVVFRMCVSPVSTVFLTCNRIRLNMAWQTTYFFANVTVLSIAAQRADFDRFLGILVLNELWLYSLYLFLAHRVVGQAALQKGATETCVA